MRKEYIYVLVGDNGRPFYCGHSVRPEIRLQEHIDEAVMGGKSFKCGHIRALLDEGQTIRIRVVDECPKHKLGDLEAYWIDQLGYKVILYNGNRGNSGKRKTSRATQ